jgi:hypothetical protein
MVGGFGCRVAMIGPVRGCTSGRRAGGGAAGDEKVIVRVLKVFFAVNLAGWCTGAKAFASVGGVGRVFWAFCAQHIRTPDIS